MTDYCVAVVSAVRARLFTLEKAEFPEIESGPRLVEQHCLVNPNKEVPDRVLFTTEKSGRTRSPSGASYSFDDHRGRSRQDATRRFARDIVRASLQMARVRKARVLVLAAERRMLGLLRAELNKPAPNGLEIRECDREMTKLGGPEIQGFLARKKLLPARERPPQTRTAPRVRAQARGTPSQAP